VITKCRRSLAIGCSPSRAPAQLAGDLAVPHVTNAEPYAALGWWWADPAAGYVLVYYGAREVREIFSAISDP
jgi:hypothetical protein